MEDWIMKKSLFIVAVYVALTACTRSQEMDVPEGDMTLVARTEMPAETKTVVEGETHVYWEPDDAIAVFSGKKSGKFMTTLSASASTATFKGTLGEDAWTDGMDLWAVYPYAADAVYESEAITTRLPSEQVARAGSFGKDMNLAVAHSTTSDLQFYNVGGGLRFSLAEDGIQEMVLEGLDGEILAGKVKVGFQGGEPTILDITEGSTFITVSPAEGGSFKKDTWYYLVAIPGALEKGFKLHFLKADNLGSRVFDKAVTIKRSVYGTLTHADEGVTYTPVSDDIISFQDNLVKSIVVKHFDTSKDGELSYREAAAVLSFLVDEADTRASSGKVSIFAGTDITSFDELVYFTGLTRIEDGAFAGCTKLESVTIPDNIVAIGDNACNGCTRLESIVVMSSTPPAIGNDAFANSGNCPISVPGDAVDAYVSAWSEYKDRIQANPASSVSIPEAVDLGLSVKWASFNLGAAKPEDYGDYYAWGETEPYYSSLNPLTWKEGKQNGYDWASYKWCKGSNTTLTKYCNNASFGNNGYTDDKPRLDPEDDAATVILGGEWRMPAYEELEELDKKCSWEWTTQNGVNGYKITGPNSNSVFLPANGGFWESIRFSGEMCMYWSSSLYLFWATDPDFAHVIFGNKSYHDFDDDDGENELGRFRGYAIRPVYGTQSIKYDVERISLDKTSLELSVGEKATLVATAFPEGAVNGSEYCLLWSSSDKTVATVSLNGTVKGAGVGTGIITVISPEGKKATCEVTVRPNVDVPEAVDLGLSVKWASFNLGASKPEESGDYYAWGEKEPYYSSLNPLTWKEDNKAGYDWASYQLCIGTSDSILKYTNSDGKTVLEPADDAAHVNLGRGWRIPTKEEQDELRDNCTWEWISNNGVDGYMISGPNGNSIFLPVTGWMGEADFWLPTYGIYWSSSLEQQRPYRAYGLYFYSEQINKRGYNRCYGQTIRPVYAE